MFVRYYRRLRRHPSAAERTAVFDNSAVATTKTTDAITRSADIDVESEVSESAAVSSAAKLQETDIDDEEKQRRADAVDKLRGIHLDKRKLLNIQSISLERNYDKVVDELSRRKNNYDEVVVRCNVLYDLLTMGENNYARCYQNIV